MFSGSLFDRNISNWNVSNVINMTPMFLNSHFCGDLSEWNVLNVENMVECI